MTKFQKIGIAIIAAIGLMWMMKSCNAHFRPGYKLAKQLKAADIGISSIEIKESSSWFEDIEVTGYKTRFKIIRLGKSVIYEQYERMFKEAADKQDGKAPAGVKIEGGAVSIIMSKPFMIWILEEPELGSIKAVLESELGQVREFSFNKGK